MRKRSLSNSSGGSSRRGRSGLIDSVKEGIRAHDGPVVKIADFGTALDAVEGAADLPLGAHHHFIAAQLFVAVEDEKAPAFGDHLLGVASPGGGEVLSALAATAGAG
jgi:hypothetical protein